jgi:hypothetical protein
MLAAAVDSSWESLSLLLLLLQLHSRCYSPCDSSWRCDRSARRESLLVNRLARSNLSACACAFRPGAPSVGLRGLDEQRGHGGTIERRGGAGHGKAAGGPLVSALDAGSAWSRSSKRLSDS